MKSTCKVKGCNEPRMPKPFSSIPFPKCQQHQIEYVLSKAKADRIKDKAGLETMRKTGKKTAKDRFYTSNAWKYCSRYVLLFYADDNLMVRCATSPHLEYHVTDKAIHCGHYLKSSEHQSTAFMFWNLFPQSYSDNVHFSGKPEIAKIWIDKQHGAGTVEMLEIKKNETYHLDGTELDKWAKFYKDKFNELLKERVITNPWK